MESDRQTGTSLPEKNDSLEPSQQITVALREVNPDNPAVAVIEGTLGKLWYRLGFVTRPKEQKDGLSLPPTLPDRFERAQMLKEANKLKDTPIGSEERKSLLDEHIRFRKIEKEFLDQKSIKLHHPEWGDLSACFTILNSEATREKPPIVFISGASNGVESVDSLVRKMAEKYPEQQIYVLGYPDAPSGEMTKEFYEAVKKDDGFKPHTQFFEATINHLIPDGDIELWGYSAGGGIAQTLLAETPLVNRVNNSVILCSGGTVELSETKFAQGIVAENVLLVTKLKNIVKYVFVDDPTKGEQKEWKFSSWLALGEKCRKSLSEKLLPKIKMKPGAKLVSVSGSLDYITRSSEFLNDKSLPELQKIQPSLEVASIPNAAHNGPFIYPDRFIDAVDQKLGR